MHTRLFHRFGMLQQRVSRQALHASTLILAIVVFGLAVPVCHAADEKAGLGVAGIPCEAGDRSGGFTLPDAPLQNSRAGTPRRRRSWFQRMFVKPSWKQVLAECTTPAEICKMVRRHVVYRQEQADHWSAAESTWQRGVGDCEDFAICIQKLCRKLGFEASIHVFYSLKPGASGHALVMGDWEGRSWMSDNGSFEHIASAQEATKRVARSLWCKPDQVWSLALAEDDIEKMTSSGSPAGIVAGPVAAAGSAM